MKKSHRKIDQHIRQRIRSKEFIKTGDALAVQRIKPDSTEAITPIPGLTYDCQFFLKQRYSRQHSGSAYISVTNNVFTFNHTDSGSAGSGTYSSTNKTWTDTGQSWTVDEWADHWLKVNSIYYKILSNTATILTLTNMEGQVDPDDILAYSIVPFEPDEFIGAYLKPNNAVSRRYVINDNDETTITIDMAVVTTASVTTGDASAPYNAFIASGLASTYGDDYWNNYAIKFTSGVNLNEKKQITDYVDATGTFTTENFTSAISLNDQFEIVDDMGWVPTTATFEIQGYMIPKPADFRDTTIVALEDVLMKQVVTTFGELDESNLPAYFNGIYSIGFTASKSVTIKLDIVTTDSLKITQKNIDSGTVTTIIDSKNVPNNAIEAVFTLVKGTEYRVDITFYAEDGADGFALGMNSLPFGWYIGSWESVLPSAPEWVSVTGETSDPPALNDKIILRFKPPEDLYGT